MPENMKKEAMRTTALFDLAHSAARPLLERRTYPWEALGELGEFIRALGAALPQTEYTLRGDEVWVANTATVSPTAHLCGPCIIGPGTEVRHCAFVRGNALVGEGCVVGNSTELKNVILFDGAQVPHYNYVGDSILGHFAHMGAGAVTSNVKQDKTTVAVRCGDERVETGLHKLGAILGDHTEVGCNAVLNPGTVVGRGSSVYPLSMVRGFVPAGSIYKRLGEVARKR